jgi:hypothetical protein
MRNKKDEGATNPDNAGRRGFLKGAGIAATAAVVAPVAGEAQATESRQDARKARYRETDHVRRFYATNRY